MTYRCNQSCPYCRWGDPTTSGRQHAVLDEILIDAEKLDVLDVDRIVLSGGEPLLHPSILEIVRYYASAGHFVVLITNGQRADLETVAQLATVGLAGVAYSLDTAPGPLWLATRSLAPQSASRVSRNLAVVAEAVQGGLLSLELGINAVISRKTCDVATTLGLIEWAEELSLDYVKFQPIFDDGYAGLHAQDMMLRPADSQELRSIADAIEAHHPSVATNNPDRWRDIADLLDRGDLNWSGCGLGHRQTILHQGEFRFCAWNDHHVLGRRDASLNEALVREQRRSLPVATDQCITGLHCFCLQSLDHSWRV